MITFVFRKQIERLKQTSNLTIVLAALLFLFLSLLSALLIQYHAIAIFLASTSSMVAGFVLALTLPRALALFFDEQNKKDIEAREKLKLAIKEQQNLLAELHRHQRMQINTESIRPLLSLTLLSVETKIRDYFKTDSISEPYTKGMVGFRQELKTRTSLFNVTLFDCECQLGVDLAGLRFERVSANRVLVTGYKSQFQGLKKQDFKDELVLRVDAACDAKTEKETGEYKVFNRDAAGLEKTLQLHAQIRERLNTGVEFQHLDKSLMQMTAAFLQAIFSPLNLKLEFTNASATERGLGLIDFLETESLKNQAETKRLESRYREIQLEMQ